MPSDIHRHNSELYTPEDLIDWVPPRNYRIIHGGLLDVGARLELFGDEGTWKSGFALHAAYSIARGSRWLGFYTSPANVLYIQGEGGMLSLYRRATKYCEFSKRIYVENYSLEASTPEQIDRLDSLAHQYAYPPNCVCMAIQSLNLDSPTGCDWLKKIILQIKDYSSDLPFVLILDPLYKMLRYDLVKEDNIKYFADNIDRIAYDSEISPAATIFIHHSRKGTYDVEGNRLFLGSDESFGSALLKWWPDTIIKCSLDPNDSSRRTVKLNFTKHPKNSEGYAPTEIGVVWSKTTLHPAIKYIDRPKEPEDELDERGGLGLHGQE